MKNTEYSQVITVFHGRATPEEGNTVGYGALINALELQVPLPDILAVISKKHRQYTTDQWRVFTPRHFPDNTLKGHLTFALKYEGIDLGVLKKIFERREADEISKLILEEPTSQYSRKIWFLYEWLMERDLNIPDLSTGNYIDLVDENIQYTCHATESSKRHRIRNNLPGVKDFCPMIRKTALLDQYTNMELSQHIRIAIGKMHPDVMARAAAFLLLKDSKASYAIEGENPPQNRAQRWGHAIAQAGQKPITKKELTRLQQIVIDNPRFTEMGFREQEGFIGDHDRQSGAPVPDHISARWKDLESLMDGMIATAQKLEKDQSFDAVLAATMVAFGFVYIHPFVDGNGRIHRYLIHQMLLSKDFVSKGIVFPVSAIILERLEEYRKVLEGISHPRLDLIEWKPMENNNVQVLNETKDLYRYFDATKQAEFLYGCVQQTIQQTIPEEVEFLQKYDRMKAYLDDQFQMPDKTVALLVRFLEQGNGKLSERAKSVEFKELTNEEVEAIENRYQEIFR